MLIVKNTAKDNPIAQQQKILLYVFPFFFLITGINFPVGVLIYWLTTNLWSMGQQFYVIRNNPQPGTPAYAAWEERQAMKRARKELGKADKAGETTTPTPETPSTPPPPTRQQPKKQSRSQRQKKSPGSPQGGGNATPPPGADPEPTD
jgi:YidC/Oxa1 family membrane protein insertase